MEKKWVCRQRGRSKGDTVWYGAAVEEWTKGHRRKWSIFSAMDASIVSGSRGIGTFPFGLLGSLGSIGSLGCSLLSVTIRCLAASFSSFSSASDLDYRFLLFAFVSPSVRVAIADSLPPPPLLFLSFQLSSSTLAIFDGCIAARRICTLPSTLADGRKPYGDDETEWMDPPDM